MGLFGRVDLHTNVNNTVGIVCQPFHIVDKYLEVVYTRHMTGVGLSFWEKNWERVWCMKC